NAKNPGASYHLGLALLRNGDSRGAESALRHGVAVSLNHPSRLSRLKWALAALLINEEKWAAAAEALEGYVPAEEAEDCPSAGEALDLRIRCLAMAGDWRAAENRRSARRDANKQAPLC